MSQIKITEGETMRWAGTWRAAGTLVSLTGYVIDAEVRMPSDPLFFGTSPAVLGNQSTAPGTYTVDLTPLELPVGSYQLRMRITEPSGAIRRSSPVSLLVESP